jgi:D-beta-D-heptose 7-phosphate kinase / D-beta-D-heptose 1-phosphate adenosyltransferase
MSRQAILESGLARIVEQFPQARVLIVGDVVLDEWISGSAATVSREAPVPAVDVARRDRAPGAAANTAKNAATLGGQVHLLSVVGEDEPGEALLADLQGAGVDTSACLRAAGRATRVKSRLVADHQVVARFDEGDTAPLEVHLDAYVARRLGDLAAEVDVVLVADYSGGSLAGEHIRGAVASAGHRRPLLIDAHDLLPWRPARASLVTPNWQEAGTAVGGWPGGAAAHRVEAVSAARHQLLARTGAQRALVTLDADGAVLLDRASEPRHIPTRPVADPHPAGAGDALPPPSHWEWRWEPTSKVPPRSRLPRGLRW